MLNDPRLPDRFWQRVREVESGCWEWTGFIDRDGYGRTKLLGTGAAHRASHLALIGPIPDGFHVDHLCRNKACVNPEHLEAVTPRVNILRARAYATPELYDRETHCKRGHEYTDENTYVHQGKRFCRACGRMRATKYRKPRTREQMDRLNAYKRAKRAAEREAS